MPEETRTKTSGHDDHSDYIEIHITPENLSTHSRLDRFLADKINISRTTIKKLFEAKEITGSTALKLNRMPSPPTKIQVHIPPPLPADHLVPEDIPLHILYEDDDLILLNKAAGMVVHPAPGHPRKTLLNGLLAHCPHLSGIGGVKRPGIVHRLDKGTSGVMVVAKNQRSHEKLIELFATHHIQRKYLTMVQKKKDIPPVGTIESLIARHPKDRLKMSSRVTRGRRAVTHYRVTKQHHCFELLELTLETGRTHQIRVHLSERLNAPILCDPLYANPKQQMQKLSKEVQSLIADYPHPLLHAQKLGFNHPATQQYIEFETPPPPPFCDLITLAQ